MSISRLRSATDHAIPGLRWLTVGPKGQPDIEIVLMPLTTGPHMPEKTVKAMRDLVKQGAMGSGVFQTPDCRKTYEELTAKGVKFKQEPADRFYGEEAVFKDDSGNWFSLTQPKDWKASMVQTLTLS